MSDQNPPPGPGDPNIPPPPPGGGYPPPPPGGGYPPPPPPPGGGGSYPGYGMGGPPQKINNWLVPSILATVLCCLPAGVVAIVYAAQVNGKLSAGDVAGAQASADKAKMWTLISVGIGVVVAVIYAIVIVAAGTSGT